MKLPESKHAPHLGLPESWDDDKAKKAIAIALAATAAAGVYHHFTKDRKGYTYIRPVGGGWFNFEIGIPERVGGELVRIRQLVGSVFSAQGDIEHLSEGEITIKDNSGELTAEEISGTFVLPPPKVSD